MGRIKIDDLPEEQKISKEVMRKVMGGGWLDDLVEMDTLLTFDLQTAVTQYNQAFTAASNLSKKNDQTIDNTIRNLV